MVALPNIYKDMYTSTGPIRHATIMIDLNFKMNRYLIIIILNNNFIDYFINGEMLDNIIHYYNYE